MIRCVGYSVRYHTVCLDGDTDGGTVVPAGNFELVEYSETSSHRLLCSELFKCET